MDIYIRSMVPTIIHRIFPPNYGLLNRRLIFMKPRLTSDLVSRFQRVLYHLTNDKISSYSQHLSSFYFLESKLIFNSQLIFHRKAQ